MSRKEIYLLVGQKGSGKSFIGTILDKEYGIRFVRVEDWAKQIKRERAVDDEVYLQQVFEEIERGIRRNLNDIDALVFESTGLTEYFDRMLQSLQKDFHVTTIGIVADSSICLTRVRSRDRTIHINISDDHVAMINEKVRKRNFETDFRIENDHKTEQELIEELKHIVGLTRERTRRVKQ